LFALSIPFKADFNLSRHSVLIEQQDREQPGATEKQAENNNARTNGWK